MGNVDDAPEPRPHQNPPPQQQNYQYSSGQQYANPYGGPQTYQYVYMNDAQRLETMNRYDRHVCYFYYK